MTQYNTGSDLLPFKLQEGFGTVNGRISIGSEDERWTLEAWAQNLTDEEYIQVGFNGPLQGTAFQSTVQPGGTFYNRARDTQTYNAFLGAGRLSRPGVTRAGFSLSDFPAGSVAPGLGHARGLSV
jgi:outer membrane receptor protein involved in Fe transport